MTTRSKLMLMAAALTPLPLYAQQPDASPAPASVPAAIAPTKPIVSAMQVEKLSPLRFIPADVDGALIIGDARFIEHAFGSIAIGTAKGDAAILAQVYEILALIPAHELSEKIGKEWGSAAEEKYKGIIQEFCADLARQNFEKALANATQAHLYPVYGVISAAPGQDEQFEKEYQDMLKLAQKAAKYEDEAEFVTIGRFSGVKITVPADLEKELTPQPPALKKTADGVEEADEEAYVYTPTPEEIVTVKGMANRTFYVLVTKEANHIIGVVCENPEEIALPETPEASVLNNPEWQAVLPHVQDDFVFGLSLNPAMNNAGYAQALGFVDWAAKASDLFEKLAGADAESAETFKAAAAGVRTIVEQAHGLMPPAESPLFCQVWGTPGAYHAELTCDAMGHTFAPAKLALADKAADPDTIFCLETTPLDIGTRYTSPGLRAVGQAALDVFNGVVATFAPEVRGVISEQSKQALQFLPELSGTCTALGTMLEGVGDSTGILVDGKGAAPKHLVDGGKAEMFRVALRTGVKDRSKIAQGWDMLIQTAGDVVEKIGQDRAMLAMLPIIPAKIANETISYNVAIPGILTPDMGANVTLNDSTFVAGSSSKLNQELVSTTGTQEFAGTTFVLNLKPLAATIRSIADAKLAAAGPIELVGEYRVEGEDGYPDYVKIPVDRAALEAAGWNGRFGYIEYNKDPLIVKDSEGKERVVRWVYESPSGAQAPAISARNRAEEAERWARRVQQVKGTITIKDDIETIRVDVTLPEAGSEN